MSAPYDGAEVVPESAAEQRQPVAAIVVAFHPDRARLRRVVRALQTQGCTVVVVDNGGTPEADALGEPAPQLHRMGYNAGVGTALNAGIALAEARGAGHVLLMDQDSVPREGMVARLLHWDAVLRACGAAPAAIGPRFADAASGQLSRHVRFARWHVGRVDCAADGAPLAVDYLITSGSLIALDTLRRVGPMDEGLFIDHVDTEWVQRAHARGLQAYGACDALMEHELGEFRVRVWPWRGREVPVNKPFRYYYIVRNSIVLYRRAYMPWAWIRVDAVRLLQILIFMTIFHPARRQVLGMIGRGLRDGLRGRQGPLR